MSGWRALGKSIVLVALLAGTAWAQGETGDEVSPIDSTSDFGFQEFPDTQTSEEPPALEGAIHYGPYLHYNRVDQWALGIDMGFRPAAGWYPRWNVRVVHAFNRGHRGLYVLEGAQPLLSRRRLLVGAQVRRFTDTEDEWRAPGFENFLSAFLFHFDNRDYFEARGTTIFAEGRPAPSLGAWLGYSDLEIESIPNLAPGSRSAFRRDEPWRPNPPVEEGVERLVRGEITVEGRDNQAAPRRGGWLRLGVQSTGPKLKSDFLFTRYEAEARGYVPLGPSMRFKTRVWAGTTGAGTLPSRKDFAVGGISTLRAHPFKERRGDHVFLVNSEYAVQVWRGRQRSGVKTNVWLLAFSDLGQAWDAPAYDLAHQRLAWDGGVGVAIADGRLSVYGAHDLHDGDAGIVWSVRLASPF